ncbi:hypothetical protein [Hornefia butyriciproducens]|uniref:hypothetical protein n=1 Tax=Hornefia butyriciproducens TaxID=2652293 RepID=UPI002A90CF78|nr:hypothetical protein [Hornefia butyriciproducens]MCI7413063.1 hypothetical protein [Clostridiales bacterium]MDY6211117.1 hypothetical protein [Hornefia butyriciproducens]
MKYGCQSMIGKIESILLNEYSGVKSITCPAIGNHHSGQTEISIPEMEITNILS